MLMCEDAVRDSLCNEVLTLHKLMMASPNAVTQDMQRHLLNMVDILMSPTDFVHVEASHGLVQR